MGGGAHNHGRDAWHLRGGRRSRCSCVRTNLRTLKRSRKPFSSTVSRVCRGEACGAIGNTGRAPCPALPLRDPQKPTGAYLAVAFFEELRGARARCVCVFRVLTRAPVRMPGNRGVGREQKGGATSGGALPECSRIEGLTRGRRRQRWMGKRTRVVVMSRVQANCCRLLSASLCKSIEVHGTGGRE